MDTHEIISSFKTHFPALAEEFNDELKPCQIDTIVNVLTKGNTLCIMPTGGGKSLAYWLAGIMTGGITIVISPLISLIDEQAEKLIAQNIEVLALHGNVSAKKQVEYLKKFANGLITPKFIIVSPEKLATDGFFEFCVRVRKEEIKLITIDEVHCVSQWGASFRPFYRTIPDFIQKVFGKHHPKILAMTATINPKELNDICKEFWIDEANIIKDQSLMRTEIELKLIKFNKEDDKDDDESGKLWDFLTIHKNEKTLVYVYRINGKRSVGDLSQRASDKHGLKAAYFHGEMDYKERKKIIEKFKNNEVNIVFATNAFGMGIDIPDIEVVIHFMIPESVEQYYQEIGRAARRVGTTANTYLFYSDKNIAVKRQYFIDTSFPNRDKLIEVYKKIPKPGEKTLPIFEDEDIQQCLHYYIGCGAIQIIAKGFTDLKGLANVKNVKLTKIIESTKNKGLILSAKKSGDRISEIIDLVYSSILDGSAETVKPLDKCLIIDAQEEELSEKQLDAIMEVIEQKRKYKHELLDYLVFQIENNKTSIELHQEIARYLGVDKDKLGLIHSTSKGDKVRSKSEVIIANLLFQHGIKYEYEFPLDYEGGKAIKPDFTISLSDNRKFFWEHLGLLGSEAYDKSWLYKLKIYDTYFPGQLVTTYEGVTITESTLKLIERLKTM